MTNIVMNLFAHGWHNSNIVFMIDLIKFLSPIAIIAEMVTLVVIVNRLVTITLIMNGKTKASKVDLVAVTTIMTTKGMTSDLIEFTPIHRET